MTDSRSIGPSDGSLLNRIRGGSEAAAGALYHRYAPRLVALARAKCGTDLAARVDADDVVQSAFASFFRGARTGLYSVPSGEEIGNLLLVITLNKVRAQGAYHRAGKRDVRKTIGELEQELFDPPASDEAAASLLRLVINEMLARLPEESREVVRLRLEGFEVAEIAATTGRAKRSVERILQTFRGKMADILGASERGS
jgi:RNA polymerase sigma factor (sigma-70 family)